MANPDQPVLAQKYRLIGQLQAGGMGSVWIAEHLHLSSLVAVKLMGRDVAATAAGTERFLLEARSAASLRSPHVVQILDYGVHEGTPFIAMELLEGESLGARLQRDGRFQSWEKAELILRQIARAVAKAHDAGIVHRDLKPSNIFLVRNEEEEIVKLLDFGIAKTTSARLNAAPGNHTRTGEFLGSPIYSSPEQLQASKALDHRADIWSLGVLAFECMVGRPPFVSDTLAGLVLAICMSPLPVPSEHGPVPPGFDAWFARTCARDVVERFQSVREASSELRRLVAAASGGRVSTSEMLEGMASGTERIPALPESVPAVAGPPSSAPTDPTVRQGRLLLPEGGPVAPLLPAAQPSPAALPWQLAAQRAETQAGLGEPPGAARRRLSRAPLLLGLSLLVAVPSLPLALRALASRSAAGLDAGRPQSAPAGPAVTSATPAVPAEVVEHAAPRGIQGDAPESSDTPPTGEIATLGTTNGLPSTGAVEPAIAEPPVVQPTLQGQPPADAPPPASAMATSPATPEPLPAASPSTASEPTAPPREEPASLPPANAPASVNTPPIAPRVDAPEPAQRAAKSRTPARSGAPDVPARAPAGRTKQARLTITASSTASVFLDGLPLGTTPIENVALEPGEHEVTFVHDGERSTQRVQLRDGEHKRVAFQPAAGDGLDEAAVQRTVRRYGAAVREECWEATLRERRDTEPSSARITATITVEPSGRVRSVATSGAPEAYPELPYCIEDEVRTWVFPSAPGETVVNVPFVFVSE